MSNFDIPECNDIDWQRSMLEMLSEHVDFARDKLDPEGHNQNIRTARDIIEALREYSGY